MKNITRIFTGVVFFSLIAIGAAWALFARVSPAQIGVKQNLWGSGGVISRDYGPGFHWGVTGIHKWHRLDRRTHFLSFAEEGDRKGLGDQRAPLEVRTKDNNRATYDVSVTYRISPGQGHLIVRDGLKNVYRDRVVATVESILREELAQLSSEELYSTQARLEVADRALPRLYTAMAEYYVEPEAVLIRAVTFPAAYEQKLQEKQLTYQQRLLAQAQKNVEDQRAVTETLQAEIEAAAKELRGDWDKRLQQARSENEVLIAKILAEAEVYDRRVRAEADANHEVLGAEGRLEIDKAEALRNELRNLALDTTGGRIYLAREAAANLRFEHVTLNSNDPDIPSILDINELTRLLLGEKDE